MIPRLDLLHTFFVVARAGSMKAAAAELGVTPGAVSQRIRELESRSGRRLFERGRAGTTPSSAGALLYAAVGNAFGTLEAISTELSDSGRGSRLQITVMPSFAATWLIPRLGRFNAAHPAVTVSIETDTRVVDLRKEPIDLAIRHGLGRYPDLETRWIASPEMIVVASPGLIAGSLPVTNPADCLRFPLLQDRDRRNWRLWFEAQGVDPSGMRAGSSFSDDQLLVRAAAHGQGLALVRDLYAAEEIADGRLVRVLDTTWPTEFAYYLVGLPATFERPAVRAFASWLLAEATVGL
ncbi:transcriptional regulator, LysR family protein [alpha proteobacterium BAL199]|jgi:LysR family transcriptional regulator, glycine cleavage system transcriptional activator|nr:transcriptional regulator, LysR family protein [alpha proteobacterium BAL199]